MPVGTFAKDLPERGHVVRQVSLFDERIRPKTLHQDVFGYNLTVTFDEREQHLECLGSDLNRLRIAGKKTLLHIDAKGTEIKKPACFKRHRDLQIASKEF